MATEQNSFNNERLSRVEKRFDEIDELRGKFINQSANFDHFKGKLEDHKTVVGELKKDLEEFSRQYTKEINNPNEGIVVKLAEVNRRVLTLEQTIKALELKFDTRIDKMYPEIEQFKTTNKILVSFSGERLEKLESIVKGSDKQKVWIERVIAAAISSGFALLVAFLKDC